MSETQKALVVIGSMTFAACVGFFFQQRMLNSPAGQKMMDDRERVHVGVEDIKRREMEYWEVVDEIKRREVQMACDAQRAAQAESSKAKGR
mmetsp:Transcript_52342/g.144837  ORF Transcript_52342/g.144837 Transcript_52342/m.144837 type:complete len:91 (-) Transcript_52342:64-336(-)